MLSITEGSSGEIWFSGQTNGNGLPVTENAIQESNQGFYDGYFLSIDNEYSLNYCSYFGGQNDNSIEDIDIDNHGNIILAGCTNNGNIIESPIIDFAGDRDAFFLKYEPSNNTFGNGSYIGRKVMTGLIMFQQIIVR